MDNERAYQAQALFVSPHFDDVALSCGGTIALEARDGTALVATVFAGDPTAPINAFARFQHSRWGHEDAVDQRRREDLAAMRVLGARHLWLDFPDAIYRDNLYLSDEDLFGEVKPEDDRLRSAVAESVAAVVKKCGAHRVYVPLGVGNHVDHQICASLVSPLEAQNVSVLLYEDIPYAVTPGEVDSRRGRTGLDLVPSIVSVGAAFEARIAAIHCYASQLPTIFRHYGDPDEVVRRYAAGLSDSGYAERFWRLRDS